ncbi:MAG: hypothetical protein FWD68_19010 [Alphaproteobacteria bacterium]|nr:hypothetical protein [Alphaproteobacteria bacterium]
MFITLGLYWNQSAFEHVLHDGYDTKGTIISAEVTPHRFPFLFDAWRPRYVDEAMSIELRWTGRDGVQRTRRGVAVSDVFAARIVSGTQVKILEIPVRVLDDNSSQPVVVDDAGDRLRKLRSSFDFTFKAGIFLTLALAVFVAWQTLWQPNRSRTQTDPGARRSRPLPVHLMLITASMLGFGAFALVNSHFSQTDAREMLANGKETVADITRVFGEMQKPGEAPHYLIELAWIDKNGQRQVYGPTHISGTFYQQITSNNIQRVKQTTIRYLDARPDVRPLIVADASERQSQDRLGVVAGAVFLAAGLFLLGLMYHQRAVSSGANGSVSGTVRADRTGPRRR